MAKHSLDVTMSIHNAGASSSGWYGLSLFLGERPTFGGSEQAGHLPAQLKIDHGGTIKIPLDFFISSLPASTFFGVTDYVFVQITDPSGGQTIATFGEPIVAAEQTAFPI